MVLFLKSIEHADDPLLESAAHFWREQQDNPQDVRSKTAKELKGILQAQIPKLRVVLNGNVVTDILF